MFLKTLTLRGFKSFADKTTLVFEPGVSVIVGPNGSGKSNVVDGISWVLGEQGPRSLRGGKMEDVIFAGSRLRPALGIAEVSLVIDNSAGLLPIDFSEVTITRTLFRSGDSEYRLNGAICRLLDIQELLSDTGIGREQHTIIGQGQLDAILTADSVQLRGFIEEAAGVAKHRRRKERALRKISASEDNLRRLSDLVSEIRRQLRPLREQAAVAQRFTELTEEAGRVEAVTASRRLAEIYGEISSDGAFDLEGPIREKEDRLSGLEGAVRELEEKRSRTFAESEELREVAWRLSRLLERLDSIQRLSSERVRGLRAELAGATKDAARVRIEELERELVSVKGTLDAGTAELDESEMALKEAEGEHASKKEALREREREIQLARDRHRDVSGESMRLRAQIAALDAAIEAEVAESTRLEDRKRHLVTQLVTASKGLEDSTKELEALEAQETPLGVEIEALDSKIAAAENQRSAINATLREAEKLMAGSLARTSFRETVHSQARDLGNEPGVLGILSEIAGDPSELRPALDAIAGEASGVLVVEDAETGARLLAKAERAIGILVASLPLEIEDATPMVTKLTGETASAKRALGRVFLAPSTQMAAELAAKYPKAIFVAPDASVAFGPVMAKAEPHGEDALAVSVAEGELASVERDLQELRSKRTEVVGRLNSHDADIAAATERLASVERETHALERELAAIEEAASERSRAKSQTITRLESLREQKPQLDSDQAQMEAAVEDAQQAHARSKAELEVAESKAYKVRLELVSMREKKRLLQERESSLESSITTAKGDLEGLDRRRASLETAAEAAAEVHRVSKVLKAGASSWGEEAEVAYQEARSQLTEVEAKIEEMRPTRSELAGELDDLRRRSREEDLGRTELRVNARVIEEKMRNEWNLDPKEAVVLYGHVWELEDLSRITDPIGKVAVLDPKALAAKEARLERDLEKMGRVNPLADQEFRSLTEREEFLAGQIADVRRSRRHLLKVVTEVDQEIKELFADAFRDASVEYERLFSMLFPGGQGRMRLVDPSDLLTSGVEVEARPGGKNLKRLSLLSGGEKALSALAFLFAIFRARPSPFYVLDEVEAALDDVNLHRFLALIREFRGSSQLLVVTHQKRTMEAADVLYGISIKPDGASRVISERLSDVSPAAYEVNGRRSRAAEELPGS